MHAPFSREELQAALELVLSLEESERFALLLVGANADGTEDDTLERGPIESAGSIAHAEEMFVADVMLFALLAELSSDLERRVEGLIRAQANLTRVHRAQQVVRQRGMSLESASQATVEAAAREADREWEEEWARAREQARAAVAARRAAMNSKIEPSG